MKDRGYTKGYTLNLTPIRVDLSCGAAALFFTKKSALLYQAIGKSPVPETVFPVHADLSLGSAALVTKNPPFI
jgi:hypothetical protein